MSLLQRTLALSLLTAATSAHAQTYTAGRIVFHDPGPYSQAELEGAAALHPGSTFTADDLAAAAQRIVDTGYFDDVTAALAGKFAAMTVTFDLKPTPVDHMLHVGFQNFVWLSHTEIEAAIHAKSPLFRDYLPEASPKQDILRTALTDALAAKGITAGVVYETVEPTLRHPVREIEFRISKPFLRVANVKLAGVSPDLVPFVQKSVNSTARTAYTSEPSGIATADQVLEPLLDAGYIQATLSNVAVDPSPLQDGNIGVVLSATLDAGDVYRVSALSFAGSPLLSAESFAASAKLHPGDVASRKALLETLAPLDLAYREQGYMDIIIVAKPTVDKAKHEVSYAVTVTPGEPYRLSEVTTENLDPAGHADFDRGFAMKAGDLYNPEYVTEFLRKNSALPGLRPYTGNFRAYAHPTTHTVELVITFLRNNR